MSDKKRIIIAITGASGIIYGIRLLESLKQSDLETHLIVSKAAQRTRSLETELSANQLNALADYHYNINDISASVASGSYKTLGMIIAPCSMRTLANIASGNSDNLLTRAADVILKERRRLILMIRESPFHLIHLKNMVTVTEMGGIIAPPIPAFYNKPKTINDLVNHSVGRTLDLLDIDIGLVRRWGSSIVQDKK